MEMKVLQSEKDLVEIALDNITVAEILRVYLNEQGVKFAAWRREHPEKPIVFRIESSSGTVKKAVSDVVKAIQKDCDGVLNLLKK
jgi:DNA-directed RNA polymerase subunit L